MQRITNLEKIPEEIRPLVEAGLTNAVKRGSLGQAKIDSIQIENSLSGGKTGAAVFVARYGVSATKEISDGSTKKSKSKNETADNQDTTYIRVIKIAPKEVCQSENEGYVKTRESLLDIFSQVEYYEQDEFAYTRIGGYGIAATTDTEYGILLYQDVGTVAASDLKGIARYFTNKILQLSTKQEEAERGFRENYRC